MIIRILLADNQPLTLSGFIRLFEDREDLKLVDLVKERSEFSFLLKKHRPEMLIVDYNNAGYLTVEDLSHVHQVSPETNILIVSADNNKKTILEVLRTGVKGYLTKDCSHEEIISAIRSIAKGEKFFCQKVLDVILEKSLIREEPKRVQSTLTARELELLKLLAKGYSTLRAAEAMNLSPHTIHTHRKKIIKKLNIKSPTEFVLYAMDLGLINPI